ncbi:unnamed protein product [Heterobilharzia americana]|nr:unnamed protein product [Heterobilharzia americana]
MHQMEQRMMDFYVSEVKDHDICLKKITTDYPNFPISKCFQDYQSYLSGSSRTAQFQPVKNECQLWVDKYTPTSCSAFLNTCPGIIKLRHWLEKWRNKNSKGDYLPKKSLCKTSKKKSRKKRLQTDLNSSSDDDFIVECSAGKRQKYNFPYTGPNEKKNETFETNYLPIGYNKNEIDYSDIISSEDDCSPTTSDDDDNNNDNGGDDYDDVGKKKRSHSNWQSKAFLLVGPHGTGKSSLIYALAKDLDFKVFELNPSTRRSGKDITSQFQSALNSHHVAKDNLSTSFSTFQMIMSSSSIKNKPKSSICRSAVDFFKPLSQNTVNNNKKVNNSTKDSDSLNLNCNSIVLFDEVDVLFESDRGFWSGLSNLLQLARLYVCHTISPPLDLVIPYIRMISLAEGYDLDVQTANSLVKSIRSSNLTFNELSTEYCDLRRLINELQWFSVSSPKCRKDGDLQNDPSIVKEFLYDPLIWVERICPSVCSLTGHCNTIVKQSVNSESFRNDDLYDLFTTEAVDDNSVPMTSEVVTKKVVESSYVHGAQDKKQNSLLIESTFKALQTMSENLSFWDICQSGVNRASLLSIVNSLSQMIEITRMITPSILESNEGNNTKPPSTDSSVSINSRSSAHGGGCMKGLINLPTEHWGPIIAFDHLNDEFFNVFWVQLLLNYSQSNLEQIENNLIASNLSHINNPIRLDIVLKSFDSSQIVSWSKCISDLNRCGVGANRCDQLKSIVCDYIPILRTLTSGEHSRQAVSTKRRFLHYFDRISLFLCSSTRKFLVESHFS